MADYYDEPMIWWPSDEDVDRVGSWLTARADLTDASIADWGDREGPLWGITWDYAASGAPDPRTLFAELQAAFPDASPELAGEASAS